MTEAGGAKRLAKTRVALLDDHRLLVDGLAARLGGARSRIEVVAAVTAWNDLLDHGAFPGDIDVAVLDYNIEDSAPFESKVQTLREARIAPVVISRHTDAATVHGVLHAGAAAFVGKNDSADELVATIAAGRTRMNATVERALAEYAKREDPALGRQEMRALMLYAGGRSIREVADDMRTTEETVKSYIKRGRRKYRRVGVDLGTKLLLRRHAIREGWIPPE
jgi:two-component system, NarL family, uhpT operon response regulator UhpA